MASHPINSSPLSKKQSIASFDQTILSQYKANNKTEISYLMHKVNPSLFKFNHVNNQISIESDLTSFHQMNYSRDDGKGKNDAQMATVKLRKLQNRAEINRAQREIQSMERKKHKKVSLIKAHHPEIIDNYQKIYKEFLKNRKMPSEIEQHSDEESSENKNLPKQVAYVHELKKHPLLLEYTLNKINSNKKYEEEESKKKFQSTLFKIRKQSGENHQNYKNIQDQYQRVRNDTDDIQNVHNPQSIVQKRFSKFFIKKSVDKLSKEVREIPRCSRMIEKQQEILFESQPQNLSKQNKYKLQNRFNEIVLSISKSEKVRNCIELPKIQPNTQRTLKGSTLSFYQS